MIGPSRFIDVSLMVSHFEARDEFKYLAINISRKIIEN